MVFVVSGVFLAISILLIWYLISYEKGPKEPKKALWSAFWFGILAIIVSPEIDTLLFGSIESLESATLPVLFSSSLGTGLIEELFKFAPLAWYIYKKNYFSEHSDGIIYFAICGLTFGFFENLSYTLIYGVEVGLVRLILVPIFHGATTGILGYFLARQKIGGGSSTKTLLALVLIGLMHGMYNFGMGSGITIYWMISLMITLLFVIGLFLFYSESKKRDMLLGLSASGPNDYCKYCGKRNVNRSVYCEYCGKRL